MLGHGGLTGRPIAAGYGAADPTLRGAAGKLERVLTDAGVPHDVKEYPGTGHGFLTDTELPGPLGPVSKIVFGMGKGRENAPDGWDRVFTFFDEHVRK